MADDLTGEAVVFVACGISGWRHVGCLSSGWLGPRGGIAAGIMSWAGEDGQQLDNAGPAGLVPATTRLSDADQCHSALLHESACIGYTAQLAVLRNYSVPPSHHPAQKPV